MSPSRIERRRRQATRRWKQLTAGEHPVIYIGTGSCGLAAGAGEVLARTAELLAERDVTAKVVEVGCIGPCYLEPIVDVQMPGAPRLGFTNVTPKLLEKILDPLLRGEVPKRRPAWALDPQAGTGLTPPGRSDAGPQPQAQHDSGSGPDPELAPPGDQSVVATAVSPLEQLVAEAVPFRRHPMLERQVRIVLRNCGIIDPGQLDHYLARGGYAGFERCLTMTWHDVIDTVKAAGLRGRGGAGFPTWKKWTFCRNTETDERYLICNADEGDPGAFMNRSLIEGDPHSLLEGMLIAAYAIGAKRAYVYIRAEYPLAIRRLRAAIADARKLGLLGEHILGSDFSLDITVKEGAGAFVCGEETALIASLEGRRGMPRTRPPFPAVSGLFGKPTVINNVETLATLPSIMTNGAEWYAQFGTESSRGTKTFSLVGKIKRTGLIEIPLGTTLREVIYDIGGGPTKEFKAVQTGGPSGGCLGPEYLDTPIDYENLAAAGSIMGSGGLIVMDRDTCIVDTARFFLGFTRQESCGKCVPCRVGTSHLHDILGTICRGEAELDDLDRLERLAMTVKENSLCGLGQTAPNPVLSSLRQFRDEYEEHIRDRRCRATVCRDLIELRIIPGNCVGCLRCVAVCPTGAISGPRAEPQSLDASKCIKCRSCVEACRYNAISGDALPVADAAVPAGSGGDDDAS